MKKRYFPKRDKRLPKGYDSFLEFDLHNGPLKEAQHHPSKQDMVQYSIPHQYEYDFLFGFEDTLYISEAKGRARDSAELRKYLYVRDYLEDWHVFKESPYKDIELFFIFENAMTPTPFAKKRKDGSKQTHGAWASKNNFRWLCKKRGDLEGIDTSEGLVAKLEEMN